MPQEKLLTVREVAQMLKLTEKEVIDLAQEGKIPAYKVAGEYLRFKPQEIEEFKKKNFEFILSKPKVSIKEKIIDFFYFNDFYIFSFLIIIILLIIILSS
jgi:excisionase family DNA binding protein